MISWCFPVGNERYLSEWMDTFEGGKKISSVLLIFLRENKILKLLKSGKFCHIINAKNQEQEKFFLLFNNDKLFGDIKFFLYLADSFIQGIDDQ